MGDPPADAEPQYHQKVSNGLGNGSLPAHATRNGRPVLDVVLSPELPERKDVFGILYGTKFPSEFLKAGGLIRFE